MKPSAIQIFTSRRDAPAEWWAGPWNSQLGIAVGYARQVAETPHYHRQMREVCAVVAGRGELMVAGQTRWLEQGALVIVEAGEVHAWVRSSPDFYMVVIHEPHVPEDTAPVVAV